MSKKVWIIFASVCVLLLATLVFLSNMNRINVDDVDVNAILGPTEQSGNIGDHVRGKADSSVVLIEYGDFQCPGCSSVFPTVEKVVDKYQDRIAFVFRNFPLTNIHPNARVAAAAAEAAGLQGDFWGMYRKLYETQNSWSNLGTSERTDYFASLADELKLNRDTFMSDLSKSTINQKISFDIAVGKKAGVDATPTFFLNGTKLDAATYESEEAFEKAITDALEAADTESKESTTEE
jgi:protein-disulfide isomerase